MKMPMGLYEWSIQQNNNLPFIALVTFSMPKQFVKSIYEHNEGRHLWGKKKCCVTLSFDCDYPEDAEALPFVADMLKDYELDASFAVVGHWLEKFPHQHAHVVKQGFEIMNHTYSHPDNELLNPGRKFKTISSDEKAEEIVRCHELCESILGISPSGFRVPHFKHLFSQDIYEILSDLKYQYSSSTWLTNTDSFGLPFQADNGIIEFPLSTCPSHPYTVYDTWHSLHPQRLVHKLKHKGCCSYLKLFKELLDLALTTGSYINIYLDPLDVPNLPEFKQMLKLLQNDDIEVISYKNYIQRQLHIEKLH